MKNHIFISALVLLSVFTKGYSQSVHVLDTIYANDQKNVALFFPEPIRQGITGSKTLFLPTIVKKSNILDCYRRSPERKVICL